jgi:hypothetical protein
MTRRRPLNLVMTAICGVLLAGAAACSSGGTSASSTTSTPAVESQQTEDSLPPPPPESTGAEQPQSQQNQPSVTLAALPVGGAEDFDSSSPKCVSVSWTGQQPLPDGVRFRISKVVIDPTKPADIARDFQVVGGSCNDPCFGHIFVPGSGQCEANVAWTRPPGSQGLQGELGLLGECIAPDAETCHRAEDILGKGPAQNVQLSAQPVEPAPASSSSSETSQSGVENSSGSSTENPSGSSG